MAHWHVPNFRPGKPWTADDCKRLVALAEAPNRDWNDVAAQMPGRTVAACRTQYSVLKKSAGKQIPRKGAASRVTPEFAATLPVPQASRSPVTITAAFFGDPPPGRSALDHKRLNPQPTEGIFNASDY